jgi:hypothetical protein
MNNPITIELTESARRVIQDLQTLPSWGMEAIARGMDKANARIVSHIQQIHLVGKGPYPVDSHRLGNVTGRLRKAASFSPAEIRGQTVTSAIGDSVAYAAVHEFGAVIHHPPRKGTVRLRTDVHGELLRQNVDSFLAVFAKKSHKLAKEVAYQAKGYNVEMPERAPFRTGIMERIDMMGQMISKELVAAWIGRK